MKAKYGAKSVDMGEYDTYEEVTDTDKLRERIDSIYQHVSDSWPASEARDALDELIIADSALGRFKKMVDEHREEVLRILTPKPTKED